MKRLIFDHPTKKQNGEYLAIDLPDDLFDDLWPHECGVLAVIYTYAERGLQLSFKLSDDSPHGILTEHNGRWFIAQTTFAAKAEFVEVVREDAWPSHGQVRGKTVGCSPKVTQTLGMFGGNVDVRTLHILTTVSVTTVAE